ncbi:uncharacterized protein LOC124634907 [Helicoverpa zea]|uniref:uncharacterized protein LOC124634907 n=1 Tax=Helicoverpa zea TaxID=7113 RepID=UPI001F56F450|nr:uncharacterized protein LOC124634907 [Helicoverpa zea]
MPKIPYKPEKTREDDEDYEIVSFEDFCDKSPGSKTDLLTLNDNINYRLCYESDKGSKLAETEGESSRSADRHTETSLNGPKGVTFKRRLSNSFAPFGRYNGKGGRAPLFSGVIPKPKNEGESGAREHRYQRFSEQRNIFQRAWEQLPGLGSGMLGVALVCALCVAAWWAVGGAVGGTWGEEHYRKLWEKTHPDAIKKPLSPMPYEKFPIQQAPEYRYHDHNNLSTKNKSNATERKKTELNKKNVYPERTVEVLQDMCSKVEEVMKFDCFPQGTANEKDCVKRGCCWKSTDTQGVPYCYYPSHYDSFRFLNMTEDKHGMNVYMEKVRPSGYPGDFEVARMDFKYLSDDALQIKIYDAEHKRFEPMQPEIAMVSKPLSKKKYRVQVDGSLIGFKVIRNSDNVTIVNTQDIGGLILSDKFLQISATLATSHVFGLGEKRARFMNDLNWNTFALFNRDRVPNEGMNLYGTQPFYLAVEHDGNSHGMLLLNSNAMDIVLQPTPGITYRTTGGILNFFVFLGPSPKEVVAQYTELVGRPFMPPYWSLGFHLCRFNYNSVNATRQVWKSNRDAGIPFDVQWNDIDYMHDHNDFTYDTERFAGLPEFVKEVHSEGMHYMIIIDPGVGASEKPGTYPPYDRGVEMDIFVKNNTNQILVGQVWNTGFTVFPDFTHPNSSSYWLEMMSNFHKQVPYDGAWIDMNEPSNFRDGAAIGSCAPENLPYMPHTHDTELRTHTLCMDARHYAGQHYDVHNLYSLTEAVATYFSLAEIRGKRPFIITRSTFVGMGKYAGHWSGDIASEWHDMRSTIPELLSFSLFGIPMMGADICGFRGDTTVELCKRWMQLGAFYPFSRNHNSDTSKPQDPVSLGPEVVAASRSALRLRYSLLPYYYTLFWRAHVAGDTVVRPLFFEAPEQTNLHEIDTQFMIGPHVMVAPILQAGAAATRAHFPAPHAWYNIRDGHFLASDKSAQLTDNETVAVKGGGIIPMQEPPLQGPVTTTNTRSSPLQLLVAPDRDNRATGELYWDDGDSLNTYEEQKYSHIEFSLNNTEIRSNVQWWGYGVPSLNRVTVLNQPPIKMVAINDQPCVKPCQFTYNSQSKVLQGCETCGSKNCDRHDSSVSAEPWVGLQIHKQLDQAIEDFYNTILDQFINSWYGKVTLQPFFVDELRYQLRYASACLLQRAVKINYAQFITSRLIPCALRHYSVCASRAAAPLDHKLALHPAAANRNAELKYLRCITNAIMPYLLKNNELNNSVFRVLIREIFAGWVLLSLTDVLADPYILNTLIVLATGDETMAQLPTTPNYKVEFLETFVRQTESMYSQRCKLLRVELDAVISDQELLYAFMQYMKTGGQLHLLQFYNDIKSFQTKILNPDLNSSEEESLHRAAKAMYTTYLCDGVPLPIFGELAEELEQLLKQEHSINKFQTSRALYQAARQSHAVLEKLWLPKFLHSEEFYKLLIGSRIPTGYQKQMVKKPHDKLLNTALKLGHRLKGALRPQAVDGQVLDCYTNCDESEGDGVDNMDILKYLDNLAIEESLRGQDLSTYKVVLTNVETKLQVPPRRGVVRVFTLAVHCTGGPAGAGAALWSVLRSEHDFHLLRSKLHEFHGDRLLLDLPLPSRRDNSPLETLRYKYEDFIQRLLQKSLLQTSELLRIFLTEDGDFSMVVQASTLNATSTDLGNIYQSVAHRLRKEKGQHLESFLRNLLVSSDIERYQALKQGTTRDVEEAQEMSEDIAEPHAARQPRTRNILASVFHNNFDVEPSVLMGEGGYQDSVVGFSQCAMYLLLKVIRIRSLFANVAGTIISVTKQLLDSAFNCVLNRTLVNLLSERRLAHLIRLGHGLLFGRRASTPRTDPIALRTQARKQLLSTVPPYVSLVASARLPAALATAFDIIQTPQLNKQLVYNLLDLCVMELFPELGAIDNSPSKLPKS